MVGCEDGIIGVILISTSTREVHFTNEDLILIAAKSLPTRGFLETWNKARLEEIGLVGGGLAIRGFSTNISWGN